MIKKLKLLIVLAIIAFTAKSQSLSPTVIASSGGFYTSANAMLSTTVAEITMVQTFTSTDNILTQGFQQPEDITTGIVEKPLLSNGFLIYPNPTNGNFVLNFTNNDNSEANIRILNMAGQIMLEEQVSQSAGLNTINFDISSYNQGMYILEITTTKANGEKNLTYHKINLVY